MVTKKTVKKKSPQPKATTKKAEKEKHPIKSIQTSKCQTVSGKSTLTYNIGVDDGGLFHIRVLSNTGGGFFSNEFIPLPEITAILNDVPVDHPITSINLIPLFKGKSVNTPAFLLAVLFNEKLLSPFKDTKRQFVYTGKDSLSTKPKKCKKTT